MPISISKTTGGATHASPFVGPVQHTDHIKLDVSTLTIAEVDQFGYLKPGVPLRQNGALVSANSGQFIYGVPIEPIKIVAENPTDVSLAADTSDPLIAVGVIGVLNRDIIEDNLGRAVSANELLAFAAAGCTLHLTTT
jgi:hypothetical protein